MANIWTQYISLAVLMMITSDEKLFLERCNPHERDARIVFDEATHKYTIDGNKVYTISVSGLVHQYFPHFDAEGTVAKYYDSWVANKNSKYFACIRYMRHVLGLQDDALIKAEIASSWTAAGNAASSAGTKTHLDVELWLNGDERCDTTNTDLAQFHAWRTSEPYCDWEPYRTEWSIMDDKAFVAGQIDSLWRDKDGKFHMIDWKRCKSLETESPFREHGYKPFDTLPHTNWGHYTVQQNAYAHILRKHYNIECTSMSLVQIHPDIPKFVVWKLKDMRDETALAFKRRFDAIRAGEVVGYMTVVEASTRKRTREQQEAADRERAHDVLMATALRARADALEAKWQDSD
jgi:hypothetical protein